MHIKSFDSQINLYIFQTQVMSVARLNESKTHDLFLENLLDANDVVVELRV